MKGKREMGVNSLKGVETKVAGFFDIETTTLEEGAFMCAAAFMPRHGDTVIFRTPKELVTAMFAQAAKTPRGVVPIFAAYNLSFDITPLAPQFEAMGYELEKAVESGNSLFYVDVRNEKRKKIVMRLWDMKHIVKGGLYRAGLLVGAPKLMGDWDYELIRSPKTPITSEEVKYVKRDVEILDKTLDEFLVMFPWLKEGDFGRSCITVASIARLYQYRVVGKMVKGRETLSEEMRKWVTRINSCSEDAKELRRAAYVGGINFVNPELCWQTVHNVKFYDIDSAYHLGLSFISLPVKWKMCEEIFLKKMGEKLELQAEEWRRIYKKLENLSFTNILDAYKFKFHAKVSFTNWRAKTGLPSPISASRFDERLHMLLNPQGDRSGAAKGNGLEISYGRVLSADSITITCDEIEFSCLAIMSDWDSLKIEEMEYAVGRKAEQPSFLPVASLLLREEKKRRKENKENTIAYEIFKQVYNSQAGLYAQSRNGAYIYSCLPLASRVTSLTRLFMNLAILELHKKGCILTSGDTDSLKIVGDKKEIRKAIANVNQLVRSMKESKDFALEDFIIEANGMHTDKSLETVGEFMMEGEAAALREMNQKARAAFMKDGKVKVTLAGVRAGRLPQVLQDLAQETSQDEALEQLQPFTWIDKSITKDTRTEGTSANKMRRFIGVDYLGTPFDLYSFPAQVLKDYLYCLHSPLAPENKRRLQQSGIEVPKEGILDAKGRREL